MLLFVNQEMAPLSKWKKIPSSIAKIKRPINYDPCLKKNLPLLVTQLPNQNLITYQQQKP